MPGVCVIRPRCQRVRRVLTWTLILAPRVPTAARSTIVAVEEVEDDEGEDEGGGSGIPRANTALAGARMATRAGLVVERGGVDWPWEMRQSAQRTTRVLHHRTQRRWHVPVRLLRGLEHTPTAVKGVVPVPPYPTFTYNTEPVGIPPPASVNVLIGTNTDNELEVLVEVDEDEGPAYEIGHGHIVISLLPLPPPPTLPSATPEQYHPKLLQRCPEHSPTLCGYPLTLGEAASPNDDEELEEEYKFADKVVVGHTSCWCWSGSHKTSALGAVCAWVDSRAQPALVIPLHQKGAMSSSTWHLAGGTPAWKRARVHAPNHPPSPSPHPHSYSAADSRSSTASVFAPTLPSHVLVVAAPASITLSYRAKWRSGKKGDARARDSEFKREQKVKGHVKRCPTVKRSAAYSTCTTKRVGNVFLSAQGAHGDSTVMVRDTAERI
ncbi:hypothetical protein B0H16DRAFT_1861456 [Mycena metata]|uniref:Uncharacterized protein n=1 Tax=Mycena metata TaxID=1033252 RepID=A0AAD7II49_9AGAR|nr:hypothetical protein B0H16DRAFT_1861456 [Mycena metata]